MTGNGIEQESGRIRRKELIKYFETQPGEWIVVFRAPDIEQVTPAMSQCPVDFAKRHFFIKKYELFMRKKFRMGNIQHGITGVDCSQLCVASILRNLRVLYQYRRQLQARP